MSRGSRLARIVSAATLTRGLAASIAAVPGTALAARGLPTKAAAVSWGRNDYGQLGKGTGFGSALYGGVGELGSGVAQVAAGLQSSLALRSDGTVWDWGVSQHRQACQPTLNIGSRTPTQVPGMTGVMQIAAGADFDLALKSDGTVWVTGCNEEGQLGVGTKDPVSGWVQVHHLSNVISVSAGYDSAVALERRTPFSTLTSVMAWGRDAQPSVDAQTPVQVQGIGVPLVGAVSAGSHYMLALGDDGSVWSWGADFQDDMGVSSVGDNPVEVLAPGSGVTQISAGDAHALALRSNGTVLAWGSNADGQLGIGSTSLDSTPAQVSGLTNVTQVSAGLQFSLAIHQVIVLRSGL